MHETDTHLIKKVDRGLASSPRPMWLHMKLKQKVWYLHVSNLLYLTSSYSLIWNVTLLGPEPHYLMEAHLDF